ncbi:putative ABC transport system permease protein [Diaminobutyricimonas aerilata]|uniref:Putative ABC transport system permease protein n=1 Tax=Diaminobutyricimonas aerilata TaxID=1162967 RepID=A0A2M9CNY4_9MICO|nr:FtsX-like permease family protein [Diaminobutyricimonas aerilata]PJJ73603.1 putative ABC transport system permease protein [Diaminobutyricimonas aerilata]
MLRLALRNVVERRVLFIGSLLSVVLGVALVQSSLQILLALVATPAPVEPAIARLTFEESRVVGITVVATTLGLAALLAVFIIASTFAFAVDQRRRELALLGLAGSSRAQLRRLLVGEAVVLGTAGALLGAPLGVLAERVQSWMMRERGFLPDGMTSGWPFWLAGVSLGVGVGLAVAGVLLAARRASRVRPLEALREEEPDAASGPPVRFLAGGAVAVIAVVLAAIAPVGGPAGGQAMSMSASIAAVIAAAALAPAIVPLAARAVPIGRGPLARLARAALRHDRRRSASMAAPVIVLVGLVAGQTTALLSFSAAGAEEQRRSTVADLVVTGSHPFAIDPATVAGVRSVSTEVVVPGEITVGPDDVPLTEVRRVALVDPAAYAATHRGSEAVLALERGDAVAGPGALGAGAGGQVRLGVAGVDLGTVSVVGAVPESLAAGPALLLRADAVPQAALQGADAIAFVELEAGADPDATAEALAAAGEVSTHGAWARAAATASSGTSADILVVVLGLGALYALLAVVNAAVIGTSARKAEFAAARATGLTRSQVLGTTALEGLIVAGVGVALGTLASAVSVVGVVSSTVSATGGPTVVIAWTVLLPLLGVAVLASTVATVATAHAATRLAPVMLLRGRE